MQGETKSALIAFLGNAYHDSRVVNLIESLNSSNIKVKTISFDWKTPDFKTIVGSTSIYKLHKSGLSLTYYIKFVYLLVRFFLKNKAELYFAEDVQTLPIVYIFSRLNRGKIFYNSREIYAHLGGLRNKSIIQAIISKVESFFIKRVDLVLVTGDMDAEYLRKSYSIDNFSVLRNLPKYSDNILPIDLRSKLDIPESEKIILYQGVLLEGRGILKIIDLLNELTNVHFVVLGEGEFGSEFKSYSENKPYKNRIHFLGAVPHSELLRFTAGADLGLALIENISISYYYALPNKLFEYIMAGVPVLSSNLPQMKNIVDKYRVGKYVDPEKEEEVLELLKGMLFDKGLLEEYRRSCAIASKDLNWENEFNKFKENLF